MRTVLPPTDDYVGTWEHVARAGLRHLNVDAWASGRRYLSLASVCLTHAQARDLARLTNALVPLLDRAVDGVLDDPDWWPSLAWPWPAIELARLEPRHPGSLATLYGRFDFLLEAGGTWQVIEYNSDTPSGGREASGLEPAIARLHPDLMGTSPGLSKRLVDALLARLKSHHRAVRRIGIVSSHSWLEDMAQATWLGWLLERAGLDVVVGDVTDLALRRGGVLLRAHPIDALYRFYPIERLYRHAIFAGLLEAAIDGHLLLLNGLRGFVAQSKACLAWLWASRDSFSRAEREVLERHLPATLRARDPGALALLPRGVVKHVNGREGDSVAFGPTVDEAGWEARLLEGGYVVQRAVSPVPIADIEVIGSAVREVTPRYACVGGFAIGGRFGGCYTRLDGPITTGQATYVATLRER